MSDDWIAMEVNWHMDMVMLMYMTIAMVGTVNTYMSVEQEGLVMDVLMTTVMDRADVMDTHIPASLQSMG